MDHLGPVAPGYQAVTILPWTSKGHLQAAVQAGGKTGGKKRKAVREGEMSEFFLKLYERGLSYRGAPKAKSQPAPEGSPKEPGVSLGPRPEKDDRLRPSRVGLAKPGPGERSSQGAKGPSGASPKECPPKKGHPTPKRGLNLVWKKPGGQQVNPGRPGRPEDTATIGKGVRSSRSTLKSLRSRAPQPAGGLDKMLAEPSRNMMRGEPAHSPLSRAKVAPSGVAPKTPPGTVKTKALVGSKRTKKTVRQTSSVKDNALQKTTRRKGPQEGSVKEKGTTLAAAHGNMEIRQKVSQTFGERSPPDLDNLLPGDLIEIFRFGYQHWAIYVGNGYVIHLAPPSELAGAGCASLMSTLTDKAWVKKELLKDVVGKCQYRVNNKHDAKYPPLPPSKIVRRAEERVGQELAYKITSENCEHFVTELRYGVAKSDQVRDAVVGVGIAGLGLAAALGIFSFAMAKKKKNQQNQ